MTLFDMKWSNDIEVNQISHDDSVLKGWEVNFKFP